MRGKGRGQCPPPPPTSERFTPVILSSGVTPRLSFLNVENSLGKFDARVWIKSEHFGKVLPEPMNARILKISPFLARLYFRIFRFSSDLCFLTKILRHFLKTLSFVCFFLSIANRQFRIFYTGSDIPTPIFLLSFLMQIYHEKEMTVKETRVETGGRAFRRF